MRAAAHIQALCALFDVTLVIINPDPRELEQLNLDIWSACKKVMTIKRRAWFEAIARYLPIWQFKKLFEAAWPWPPAVAATKQAIEELAPNLDFQAFDVVHCFRLHTAWIAKLVSPAVQAASQWVLDIDDYESHARFRYARALLAEGHLFTAASHAIEALKYASLEAALVPRFKITYVCSEIDRVGLGRRFGGESFRVLRNVVLPPANTVSEPAPVFTFLFVGALDYPPNKEGIVRFCREVLPLLRVTAPAPFRVLIVGRNPGSDVLELANRKDVEVVANPPDISGFYRAADVCIAPIYAGGGTRIKILEAFSFAKPVVATAIGAEGLEAVPGKHAEIADGPEDFARACACLMAEPARRSAVAHAGNELWRASYGPAAVFSVFAAANADLLKRYPGTEATAEHMVQAR